MLHTLTVLNRIRINGLNIGWAETEDEDATQRAVH
jgi:hypothetical protein